MDEEMRIPEGFTESKVVFTNAQVIMGFVDDKVVLAVGDRYSNMAVTMSEADVLEFVRLLTTTAAYAFRPENWSDGA